MFPELPRGTVWWGGAEITNLNPLTELAVVTTTTTLMTSQVDVPGSRPVWSSGKFMYNRNRRNRMDGDTDIPNLGGPHQNLLSASGRTGLAGISSGASQTERRHRRWHFPWPQTHASAPLLLLMYTILSFCFIFPHSTEHTENHFFLLGTPVGKPGPQLGPQPEQKR